jgi:outer membrane protein insertion porin family
MGGDRVPIFERLYLGGANNLRGYKFRDVGPKDENGEPLGGNTLVRATIEYTFPVINKVRGAVFYDVGYVNEGSYKFTPTKQPNGSGGLNMDVGLGVRLDLPIGPVRIDYGIPISSDAFNDSGGKFNFNIGYQF